MSEAEREMTWAAGLFEGEGCITLSKVAGRLYLLLSLSLHPRDEDVLRRFHLAVGVGSVNGPHKNGMMRWAVTGKRAEWLLSDPHFLGNLGVRRRARAGECLYEVASQPAPMSNRDSGHRAGIASGIARRQKARAST